MLKMAHRRTSGSYCQGLTYYSCLQAADAAAAETQRAAADIERAAGQIAAAAAELLDAVKTGASARRRCTHLRAAHAKYDHAGA